MKALGILRETQNSPKVRAPGREARVLGCLLDLRQPFDWDNRLAGGRDDPCDHGCVHVHSDRVVAIPASPMSRRMTSTSCSCRTVIASSPSRAVSA